MAAETPHGGSSVTNLHLADIAQWKSFGARSNSLLRLPSDVFSDASISARLQCDMARSAVKSAQKLQPHDVRLLIVIPAVEPSIVSEPDGWIAILFTEPLPPTSLKLRR